MKLKLRKLQLARRATQLSVIALILLIPAMARYANYLSARELDKKLERWDGSLQGKTLAAIDWGLRQLPDGETERAGAMVRNRTKVLTYAQQLRGGVWSLELPGVSMTDPLAAAESFAAAKRIPLVLLISLIIPILITVVFGRVFCSWLCPMNLLLEFNDKLRAVLRFLELKPRNQRFSRWTKYAMLATGLALAAVLSIPVLGYIYAPAIIGRELHEFTFGLFDHAEQGRLGFWLGGLTLMSLVIVAIAVFELTISRRWWCRYLCPGGALYSLLGWARLVRVRRAGDKCVKCHQCVDVCQVGLVPMRDRTGHECDNCGLCISHCSSGALGYSL